MRYPVLCDGCPIAQPDAFVTLDVLEQPRQRADPAGAPDDPAMQTDAHHARAPFGSHAVEPVERIPAVGEEVVAGAEIRSEEHTSELQSRENLVCRLLLEKKNTHDGYYL